MLPKRHNPGKALLFLLVGTFWVGISFNCKREKAAALDGGYPAPVAAIIQNKCAVSGCHTSSDKANAMGLDLSTWTHLFEGTDDGENVCIPYYSQISHLFLHTNTYSDLGDQHEPTMPYNHEPLSRDEVQVLKDWIDAGAPDEQGHIAFTDQPERRKIYLTNQGCDNVAVIDAASGMLIRIVEVGTSSSSIESPHALKVSPNKKYWYVIFANGSVIQKYDANTDKWIADIPITYGSWNQLLIAPDGKSAFALDFSNEGRIAYVDLENNAFKKMYSGAGLFVLPHGLAATADFKTLYIASTTGNFVYKMDVTDPMNPQLPVQVSLTPNEAPSFNSASNLSIHDFRFTPDYQRYIVTSQGLNQVRIYQASNDSLLKIIPVGSYPQELAFDNVSPYVFVGNMEDAACNGISCKGSIQVIDYLSMSSIITLADGFYQPHGIIVDPVEQKLYIANRNVSATGVPPHHGSTCHGNPGYVSRIDIATLSTDDYKVNLFSDTYGIDYR